MRAAVDYLTSLFFKLERAACVRVLCFSPFAGGGREREREREGTERERERERRERKERQRRGGLRAEGERKRERECRLKEAFRFFFSPLLRMLLLFFLSKAKRLGVFLFVLFFCPPASVGE